MTVKQLMNKLKKLPENAIITVYNNEMFINGEYVATEVGFDADYNTVMIDTDYKKRIGGNGYDKRRSNDMQNILGRCSREI